MHTVVFGWFGASAVWFLPLLWRVVKSVLPNGGGLRGPGTIRLWLGFFCVLLASCTLEAALFHSFAFAADYDHLGRWLLLGLSGHDGAVGSTSVLGTLGVGAGATVLLLISLPWLCDFTWRQAIAWANGAFGLGLKPDWFAEREKAPRERSPRGRVREREFGLGSGGGGTGNRGLGGIGSMGGVGGGSGSGRTSHDAPALGLPTTTQREGGRYQRPTVWRPPSPRRVEAERPTSGRDAARPVAPAPSSPREPRARANRYSANTADMQPAGSRDDRGMSSVEPLEPIAPAGWLKTDAASSGRSSASNPGSGSVNRASLSSTGTPAAPRAANVAPSRRPEALRALLNRGASTASRTTSAGPVDSSGSSGSPAASGAVVSSQTFFASTTSTAAAPSKPAGPPLAPDDIKLALRSIEESTAQWVMRPDRTSAPGAVPNAGIAGEPVDDSATHLRSGYPTNPAASVAMPASALPEVNGTTSITRPAVDSSQPLPVTSPPSAAADVSMNDLSPSTNASATGAHETIDPNSPSTGAAIQTIVSSVNPPGFEASGSQTPPWATRSEQIAEAEPTPFERFSADAAAASPASTSPDEAVTRPPLPPYQVSGGSAAAVNDDAEAEAGPIASPIFGRVSSPVASREASAEVSPIASPITSIVSSPVPTPISNVVHFPRAFPAPEPEVPEPEPEQADSRQPIRGFVATEFEFHAPAASAVDLPGLDLLEPASDEVEPVSEQHLADTGQLIEQRLQEFKVPVTVVGASAGPVITRFEVEPALGVRGSQIVGLMKDLSRGLGLTSIRVVETIPGKTCMGLELPNAKRQMIRLSEILEADVYRDSKSFLTIAMGKDIVGNPVVTDLARAPHMLVAGTTGSGKSVAINAMILSLLYKAKPEDVRLIMIDPKMLELSVYEGIPHLLAPVVTDMKLAANALNWCVGEMEKRYKLMSAVGVRNLQGFNQKVRNAEVAGKKMTNPFSLTPDAPEPLSKLPMIVVVIDELADLMMVAGKQIEQLIARLAQKARAAGIHLILATQRPSVDVITGLIKANIPTRVAFQVSSKIDSRTILDQMGAESLLGAGDMLFLPPGTGYPQRVHGAFVADEEVHSVVEYLKQFGEPEYEEGILSGPTPEGGAPDLFGDTQDAEADLLYDEAVSFVLRTRRASISSVQRQLRIGYNRAARLVEQMEAAGLVSPMGTNGNREVLAPAQPE